MDVYDDWSGHIPDRISTEPRGPQTERKSARKRADPNYPREIVVKQPGCCLHPFRCLPYPWRQRGDCNAQPTFAARRAKDQSARLRRRTGAHSSALTDAESRVLELVGQGLSDSNIAARVASSRRTVPSQVASAQRKLGAANREHAWQLMADEAG